MRISLTKIVLGVLMCSGLLFCLTALWSYDYSHDMAIYRTNNFTGVRQVKRTFREPPDAPKEFKGTRFYVPSSDRIWEFFDSPGHRKPIPSSD